MSDKRFCAPLRGQAFVASRSSQQAVSPLRASILGVWRSASAAERREIILGFLWPAFLIVFLGSLGAWAKFGEFPL
jgi:hypothetical protein